MNDFNKILFVKLGNFSLVNDNILLLLKREFGNYEIEVIDVKDIWKEKLTMSDYIKNLYFFTIEYGKDFLKGNKKIKDAYSWTFGTSYIAAKTNEKIQELVKDKKYKFTFQTQALFNAKISGIPHFIYTDHTTRTNLLYPSINPRQYIRSNKFIEQEEVIIYKDADAIFTCGSLISYSLLNQYHIPENKILTVYAGSNVTNEYIPNNTRYKAKNILFVGVDWERKGGPILLKIFEKILQKHPDASLTIIGCSPKNITLPNCTVVGNIPASKLFTYYNAATIFCLPTLREPFGIVFVEAMHYKLPIVANNIGCIPDMVIDNFDGFLVNNDVDKYAEKICELLDDPDKCKLFGENGYNLAQTKFNWESVGSRIKNEIDKYL